MTTSNSDYERVFGEVATAVATQTFAQKLGREPTLKAPPQPETAGSGAYKPYGFLPTGSINESCEVNGWVEGTDIPEGLEFPYRLLMLVQYHADDQIKLFLPDCILVLEGRRLTELRRKLARRQVTFIQQYSSRRWQERPPEGETFIEKIEIVRPQGETGQGHIG